MISEQPTANRQQPTANRQQPTANTQQPTANTQQPTANRQQPTAKVFVSGCYDLLHSGHVEFFRQAAEYGDLYVGIGSDKTIEAYKHHKFPPWRP